MYRIIFCDIDVTYTSLVWDVEDEHSYSYYTQLYDTKSKHVGLYVGVKDRALLDIALQMLFISTNKANLLSFVQIRNLENCDIASNNVTRKVIGQQSLLSQAFVWLNKSLQFTGYLWKQKGPCQYHILTSTSVRAFNTRYMHTQHSKPSYGI